ncbi:unnamed protein product, partial [Vitis vinifera]
MMEILSARPLDALKHMIAGKKYFNTSGHGNEEARRAIATIQEFLSLAGAFVLSDAIPGVEWMDSQGYLGSMKRVAKEVDSLVGGWVEEHEMRLNSEGSKRQDLIDVMLSVLEDTSMFGHSRETVIKATVMTLMVGGTDTVATTSTWLLSALLNNKHALKRAQEELDLKVGRGRWVEESDIPNLHYLQAVIKETLRLYTAAPLSVPHEAMEDCHVAGYHIPKGTRLFVNAWKLHRDPSVWSDPEDFQPERFLTSHADLDVLGQHFELIPFGSGRRSCPGITMALKLLHLVIGRLLQGFDLSTPLNAPVDMREGLSIILAKVTPLEVMLTPRLPSQFY